MFQKRIRNRAADARCRGEDRVPTHWRWRRWHAAHGPPICRDESRATCSNNATHSR